MNKRQNNLSINILRLQWSIDHIILKKQTGEEQQMKSWLSPFSLSFVVNHFGYNGLLVISLAGSGIMPGYPDWIEQDYFTTIPQAAIAFLRGQGLNRSWGDSPQHTAAGINPRLDELQRLPE